MESINSLEKMESFLGRKVPAEDVERLDAAVRSLGGTPDHGDKDYYKKLLRIIIRKDFESLSRAVGDTFFIDAVDRFADGAASGKFKSYTELQNSFFKDLSENRLEIKKYTFKYIKDGALRASDGYGEDGWTDTVQGKKYVEYDGFECEAAGEEQAWAQFLSYDGKFGIPDQSDYTCSEVLHPISELARKYGCYRLSNGRDVAMTEHAYIAQNGSPAKTFYEAGAVDTYGFRYRVQFKITDEYRKSEEAADYMVRASEDASEALEYARSNYVFFNPDKDDPADYSSFCEDESNACRWHLPEFVRPDDDSNSFYPKYEKGYRAFMIDAPGARTALTDVDSLLVSGAPLNGASVAAAVAKISKAYKKEPMYVAGLLLEESQELAADRYPVLKQLFSTREFATRPQLEKTIKSWCKEAGNEHRIIR